MLDIDQTLADKPPVAHRSWARDVYDSFDMDPDDHVCLCFRVSLRKIRTYLKTEDPPVASLISECLGAGTGCRWCVPFLEHLHAQHQAGELPDLNISPQRYAEARQGYHKTGDREIEPERHRADEGEDPASS